MDPIALVPFIGLFGGLAAAVYAALRFNREDAGQTVQQQSTIVDDAVKLAEHLQVEVNRLQDMLDKVRAHRDRLEKELAESTVQNRQLEENLRMAIIEQNRLEAMLVELGRDPGHADV